MYTFVDLFSGTGAFSHVLQKTNRFKCVFSNDMMKCSETIYNENHDHALTLKDLHNVEVEDVPDHNLICGGFPCQPFSIAGERKGFDDERSNVFWKILEIIDHRNPEIVLLENVKNLTTHDNGNTFRTILNELQTREYHVKYAVLDTCKITCVPQHRERIYIIGFRNKHAYDHFHFDFPNVPNKPIKHFLQDNVDEKYYYTDRFVVYPTVRDGVKDHINEKNTLYQLRRQYVRENKSNCCPTMTANMGGGGHNVPLLRDDNGIRKLTPRECFNLQGFPSNYKLPTTLSDSNLYKLAGNAVSVPVVELIVSRLLSFMDSA